MAANAGENKRIAKNVFFLYGRLLFVLFISIYTTRVVLNCLGVVDYGVYNVVCGFVAMFSFLNATLSSGIQRFYNYERGRNGLQAITKVYQTAVLIQVLVAVVTLILVEPIGLWYLNNKMVIPPERLGAANWIFQFSVVSLVVLLIQIPYSAAVMAYEKMNFYAFMGIADAAMKLGIVLLLPYLKGDSLILYGVMVLAVSIIDTGLYIWYSLHNFKELKLKLVFHKGLFADIFKFSGWNVCETFAWMTQGQGVNMVLNYFCGPIVNAAHGVAGQIHTALSGFCSNLVAAFRPQLVQSYASGNTARTTGMMYVISKAMFAMFYMLAVPLILDIHYVLEIWIGENVPDYTAKFSILVLLSVIPKNFSMGLSQVVHATGRLRNYQLGNTLIVMMVLPLSYVLLKTGFSPNWVYLGNLIVCCGLWAADVLLLHQVYRYSIRDYLRRVILPCGILILLQPVLCVVIRLTMAPSFLRLVLICLASVVSMVGLGYLFLLNPAEKAMARNFIASKLHRKN